MPALRSCLLLLTGAFVTILSGCRPATSTQPAGIALSFDDRFVNEWFRLRPLFKKYGAHVTFYVTQFDSLTPTEINQLKILQQDGHEIGCHGAIHTNSKAFVRQHSMEKYLKDEIFAALRAMKRYGFRPTSFAHPGGVHTNAIDHKLLQYFVLLRDVALIQRSRWGITLRTSVHFMPGIYYQFDGDQTVDALLFDEGAGLAYGNLKDAMRKAHQDGTVLMLFGHKPYSQRVKTNEYGFLTSRLDSILAESRRLKLKTYTMSELVMQRQSLP